MADLLGKDEPGTQMESNPIERVKLLGDQLLVGHGVCRQKIGVFGGTLVCSCSSATGYHKS